MQNNDFLPADYEAPSAGGNYTKLQEGDNKLRILSKPILGWVGWDNDKKVHRFTMNRKPDKPLGKDPIRHFWAFVVWNYELKSVQVLEVTQQTIQSQIQNLSKNEDWGAPFEYDITISKKGKDKETKYHVTPSPKKKVGEEVHKAALDKPVYLEALYSGADPFVVGDKQTVIEISDLPF